jgi:hypothetical protein
VPEVSEGVPLYYLFGTSCGKRYPSRTPVCTEGLEDYGISVESFSFLKIFIAYMPT